MDKYFHKCVVHFSPSSGRNEANACSTNSCGCPKSRILPSSNSESYSRQTTSTNQKSESLQCRAKEVGNKLLTTLPTKESLRQHWLRYAIPLLAAQIAGAIVSFGWRKLLKPSSPSPSPPPSCEIVENSDSDDVPKKASS